MWKYTCDTLINGSFVVAMQKKAHVPYFPCNHLKLWPCQKRATVHCLVHSASPSSDWLLRGATFLYMSVRLSIFTRHGCSWVRLIQEALELIFAAFFLTTLSPRSTLRAAWGELEGGLIHQKLWFQCADLSNVILGSLLKPFLVCYKLQWHSFMSWLIHFHMCCPWKHGHKKSGDVLLSLKTS